MIILRQALCLYRILPIMPLYFNGKTKFAPIHVTDLVDIIQSLIERENNNLTLECVGPDILTFKEILQKLLNAISKKRILLPLPLPIAKLSAKILQLFPKPLLTEDQLNLLKYDNCSSGIYMTNYDLGFQTNRKFDIEIEKYSYNWRSGGQFAKVDEEKIK